MATCGYLCPACEGRGYTEEGDTCTWCKVDKPGPSQEEVDDWVSKVHQGPCCWHGEENMDESIDGEGSVDGR